MTRNIFLALGAFALLAGCGKVEPRSDPMVLLFMYGDTALRVPQSVIFWSVFLVIVVTYVLRNDTITIKHEKKK
jgi:hypothetical protein